MFTNITTLPRRAMQLWGPNLSHDESIVIVSIRDTDCQAILPDGPRLLNLAFDDIDGLMPTDAVDLFTPEQARRVIDFLLPFVQSDLEFTLIAQCHAGVSRSGAIAVFAQRLSQMPWDEFASKNPHIEPNGHVLSLLMREERKRKEEEEKNE